MKLMFITKYQPSTMPCLHILTKLALILPSLLSYFIVKTKSSSCDGFTFDRMGESVTNCRKLGTLGAEFGWSYHIDTKTNQTTMSILFGAKPNAEKGWVAWGVNPRSRPHMIGTRALIGFKHPNGTTSIETYNITSDTKMGCRLQPSEIKGVGIETKKATYSNDTMFLTIFATITLPSWYKISNLNHVWQVGSWEQDFEPQMHDDTLQNFDSAETINLYTGKTKSVRHDMRFLRPAHGILNIVGWGTLMPVGAIIARYFKEFPVKFGGWYYVHVACQISGYLIGSTGWAIGIWLGDKSRYYNFITHGDFGIIIFTFTTLQVLALYFRPNKIDEYRKYWNLYHHILGYTLIILIAVNIFKGINILRPNMICRHAYAGLLGTLALITVILEVFTWTKFTKQKQISRRASI